MRSVFLLRYPNKTNGNKGDRTVSYQSLINDMIMIELRAGL